MNAKIKERAAPKNSGVTEEPQQVETEILTRENFYYFLFSKDMDDGKMMSDIKHGFMGTTDAIKRLRKLNIELMDSYFKVADLLVNHSSSQKKKQSTVIAKYLEVADEFESALAEARMDGSRMIDFVDGLVGALTGTPRKSKKNVIEFAKPVTRI